MLRSRRTNLENVNRERVKANQAVKKVPVGPVQKRSVAVRAAQATAATLSNDPR